MAHRIQFERLSSESHLYSNCDYTIQKLYLCNMYINFTNKIRLNQVSGRVTNPSID